MQPSTPGASTGSQGSKNRLVCRRNSRLARRLHSGTGATGKQAHSGSLPISGKLQPPYEYIPLTDCDPWENDTKSTSCCPGTSSDTTLTNFQAGWGPRTLVGQMGRLGLTSHPRSPYLFSVEQKQSDQQGQINHDCLDRSVTKICTRSLTVET